MPDALRMVEGLDKEAKQLKSELIRICWWMRGSISLDEAFALSFEERSIIADLIKENLETTKKTQMPFF